LAENQSSNHASLPHANLPTRYGVIGLGRMGSLHLQILKTLSSKAEVVALVDSDPKRLRRAKRECPKAYATANYKDLLGKIDAASICTPTESHCEIAEFFLENKVPVLVEKPIATNLTEAEKILWASHGTGTHLHIGHIERFNPAVVKARELIKKPIFIEAVRFGPYEPRVHGIGVILDLMIHDLDLVLWLLSDLDIQLEDFEGQGLSLISPHEDLVKARLRFREKNTNHPIIVDLTANRLSFERFRKMRIFQEESYITLDLLNYKLRDMRAKRMPPRSLKDIETVRPSLPKTNPLKQELEHFLASVNQDGGHNVHPKEAWDALEIALQLIRKIEKKNLYSQHQPLNA